MQDDQGNGSGQRPEEPGSEPIGPDPERYSSPEPDQPGAASPGFWQSDISHDAGPDAPPETSPGVGQPSLGMSQPSVGSSQPSFGSSDSGAGGGSPAAEPSASPFASPSGSFGQ